VNSGSRIHLFGQVQLDGVCDTFLQPDVDSKISQAESMRAVNTLDFEGKECPCLTCRSSGVKWKCSAVISIVSRGTLVVSRPAGIGSNSLETEQPKTKRANVMAGNFAEGEGICATGAFAFGEEPPHQLTCGG
jgi:hypothetical protein